MRVPVYNQQRVRSAPLSPPRVRAPGPDGTEELGRGISQVGGAALEIATDARDRADDVRVEERLLQLGRRIHTRSEGTGGVRTREGAAALEWQADYDAMIQDREDLAADLSDRQRALYQRKAEALTESERRRWEAHTAKEFTRHDADVTEGRMQQALTEGESEALAEAAAAIAAGKTGEEAGRAAAEAAERALQRLLVDPPDEEGKIGPGALKAHLMRRGLPKERIDQLIEAYRRKGHLQALGALMRPGEEHPDAAAAYLATVGDLLGKEGDPIRRAVEVEQRKRRALGRAGDAFASSMQVPREGAEARPNRETAYAALDGLPLDEREDAVLALDRRLEEEVRAWAQKVVTHVDTAWQQYDRGGISAIGATTRQWLEANAPTKWREIRDYAGRKAREWRADQQSESAGALVALRSDLVERPHIYAEMSAEEFQARWRPLLSDVDYKTAGALLATAKKGTLTSMQELKLSVDDAMAREGITSKSDQEKYRAYVQQRHAEHLATAKRPPSFDELQSWFDTATEEVLVRRWIGKPKARQRYKADRDRIVEPEEEQEEAPPPAAPPPGPKRIVKYQRTKDGTRRRAVYDDGSYGPVEVIADGQ